LRQVNPNKNKEKRLEFLGFLWRIREFSKGYAGKNKKNRPRAQLAHRVVDPNANSYGFSSPARLRASGSDIPQVEISTPYFCFCQENSLRMLIFPSWLPDQPAAPRLSACPSS